MDIEVVYTRKSFLELNPSEKLLYLSLAINSTPVKTIFGIEYFILLSWDLLHEMTGQGLSTTQRLMPRLKEKGFVSYKRSPGAQTEVKVLYPPH